MDFFCIIAHIGLIVNQMQHYHLEEEWIVRRQLYHIYPDLFYYQGHIEIVVHHVN